LLRLWKLKEEKRKMLKLYLELKPEPSQPTSLLDLSPTLLFSRTKKGRVVFVLLL